MSVNVNSVSTMLSLREAHSVEEKTTSSKLPKITISTVKKTPSRRLPLLKSKVSPTDLSPEASQAI